MKKEYLLLLLLVTLICCKANKNVTSENVKNNYIKEVTKKNTLINTYINSNYISLYALNEYDFTQKIDSLKRIYTTQINQYKDKLDDSIIKDDLLSVHSTFYQKIIEYPERHKRFTGENVVLSKINQERINSFSQSFNNVNLFLNKNLKKFMKSYITIKSNKRRESHIYDTLDNQQLIADWNTIETLFKNQSIIDFWKQEYLYDHIDNMGIKNIDDLYQNFMTSCKTPEYTNKIRDIYNLEKRGRESHSIEVYKTVDGFELDMHLFLPDTLSFKGDRPTIVQFHGGSWSMGKPDWFFGNAKAYAKQGWVVAVVEYRTKGKQGTYPFESVKDAKSAIRWLRKNAERLNIDSNKIVASGNSAGGHLAIATSLVENWNEKTDDITISSVPNVIMVNAAVYDLTNNSNKWIVEKLDNKEVVKEISPNNLITKSATKMLLIHGEKDTNCPYNSAKMFYNEMKLLGNDIELHTIKDATHFIWYGRHSQEVSKITSAYIEKLNF